MRLYSYNYVMVLLPVLPIRKILPIQGIFILGLFIFNLQNIRYLHFTGNSGDSYDIILKDLIKYIYSKNYSSLIFRASLCIQKLSFRVADLF